MKKELIEYVKSDKFESISFNGIKKYLGVSKKHMNEELKELRNKNGIKNPKKQMEL